MRSIRAARGTGPGGRTARGAWSAALAAAALAGCAFLLRPAGAQEEPGEECLACHGLEGFASAEGRPLFVEPSAYRQSVHGALPCTGCHADAQGEHPERRESLEPVRAEQCASCHVQQGEPYRQSVHGRERAHGGTEAATCTSCHGPPHALRKVADPGSPAYPLNLPRTCAACHADPELARRHNIPVLDAYELYLDSIHGRALTRSGLLVAANCSSCHGVHDIQPRENPASHVYRANVRNTGGKCHAGVARQYWQSAHGTAARSGEPRAPVCIDCHTAHRIARVDTPEWKLQVVRECGGCHEESLRTYRDTLHGQVTALGFVAVARCSDCHGAHDILPAAHPASSVAPANLVRTCRKCHPNATAKFVQFSPHADPSDRAKNPGLYYTARFMEWLILAVFAFFGTHTLLWLVRSLWERGPSGPPRQRKREEE